MRMQSNAISQIIVPPITTDWHQPTVQALLRQVIAHYQKCVGAVAHRYLIRKLGCFDVQLVRELKLGFVDRSLGKLLPHPVNYPGAAMRGQLQRLGILNAQGHEEFRGAIIWPLENASGDLVGIHGEFVNHRPYQPRSLALIWGNEGGYQHHHLDNQPTLCTHPADVLYLSMLGQRSAFCIQKNISVDWVKQNLSKGTVRVFTGVFGHRTKWCMTAQNLASIGVVCHEMTVSQIRKLC